MVCLLEVVNSKTSLNRQIFQFCLSRVPVGGSVGLLSGAWRSSPAFRSYPLEGSRSNRWVRRYLQPVRRIHKTVGFGDIHNLYGEYIKPFGFKDIPYSTTIADSRVTKLTYSQNKIKILLNVSSFRVSPHTSISCRSLKFVPTLTDILVGV